MQVSDGTQRRSQAAWCGGCRHRLRSPRPLERQPRNGADQRRRMMRIAVRRCSGVSSVIAVATLLVVISVATACAAPAGTARAVATSVRVEADRRHPGALYARIDGREVQIASAVFAAWLLDGG